MQKMNNNQLILIVGVSNSRKSTIGKVFGRELSISFFHADDFYSAQNIAKMQAVKKSLEQPTTKVADAVLDAGYNDPKAFRAIFKKIVGISPLEYKQKFQ